MEKRESTFSNMVVALLLVTLISAGALGFVYEQTRGDIEAAKLEAKNKAIRSVLPQFEEIKGEFKKAVEEGGDSLEFYPAYNGDEFVGVAIKSYTKKGFSGIFTIMAGIGADGNISGYEVLEHKETPGLGSKMVLWFKNSEKPNQVVIGKSPETTNFRVAKDGGDIDAITASTITSRAFLDAIVRAYDSYKHEIKEHNGITATK